AQGQQQMKSPVLKDEQRAKSEEGKMSASGQQSEPPPLNESLPPLNIEPPDDPEEDLRLQQLQAAAAQWQQHPHHRVGFQYQRIMQKHAQLQQMVQQYQQIMQQPPHLETMSVDMQLRHYEAQQKQFQQLYKDWERSMNQQWQHQLQTYPHKDQLQEYEKQWKAWDEQMKVTQSHLQEKVTSLQNLKNQYPANASLPPPFIPYSQTGQGGIPIMPPTLPSTTPPLVPPPLSSVSQLSNSSVPLGSSSQSSQAPETPRPALLPTPGTYPSKIASSASYSPYHSQVGSSFGSSDHGKSHLSKQTVSISSEQQCGELKGTSAVSSTHMPTVQDKPVRSGGLLPDPPRSARFEGPRGPREQKEQLQKLKEFKPDISTQDSPRAQNTNARPAIKPSPAVIIKPPVLFRQPTPVARPSAPLARSTTPMARPHAPVSTPTTTPSNDQSLKPSPSAVEQERWDEDSFHGLWDTNEDKGANMEYELCKHESMMPPPVSSPVKVPAIHTSIPSAVPVSLSPVMPPVPKAPVIQQTVDYGHGRDITTSKVEQIPYGERVTLRPEPLPDRQTFQKEHPGRYNRERDREPYFERQGNSNTDHRDFKREREMHRDRGSVDYERERFEKERVLPTTPSRTQSYRDKKDHPSSRRGGFERPPYERKTDRPPYDHGPSMFGGDRRNYPEERIPISAPSMPRQPPPTPRVERKPESKNVDDILKPPGRESRPERIVIIMRGLPGSGKTHVAKLIRDKEVECGGPAPRVLSLDDYFITEVEKEERDPDTGKKVKKKVMEYEYEADMEETYRTSMFKTFKKTLDDGFFPFIILDAINDRVRHFEQFWSAAKTKGFEVYLAEMSADNQTCSKRNIHGRKLKDISRMSEHWEAAPRHMMRLDIRSLLQDAAIEEVEMEDFDANIEDQKEEVKKDTAEEEESELGYIPKSKWEMDTSEAKLDKLDGLRTGTKRKRDWEAIASRMEDYLQLPDDYDTRASEPGKKRVRWADLEEKKDADRKRAIGFVVGQTDWEKITDESGHLAERALNRTKYI
uniref:YLP motif-containing protein 1 n=1 Tax=Malurus cyaneus samueli TaxID=2593467 RepID=A0A8C5T7Z3_9PASS